MNHLTFLLLIVLTAAFTCTSASALKYEDLDARSELWPHRATVTEPEGTGVEGLKGRRLYGFLLRVEGDEALMYFTLRGVQSIPLKKTDILERAREIAEDPERLERQRLFVDNVLSKSSALGRALGDAEAPIWFEDRSTHFLVVHMDLADENAPTFIEVVKEGLAELNSFNEWSVQVLLVPEPLAEKSYTDLLQELELTRWFAIAPFQVEAFRKVLVHGEDPLPKLVVVDYQQAIVAQSENALTPEKAGAFLESVPDAVRAHEARRKAALGQ